MHWRKEQEKMTLWQCCPVLFTGLIGYISCQTGVQNIQCSPPYFQYRKGKHLSANQKFLRWRRMTWPNSPSWMPLILLSISIQRKNQLSFTIELIRTKKIKTNRTSHPGQTQLTIRRIYLVSLAPAVVWPRSLFNYLIIINEYQVLF